MSRARQALVVAVLVALASLGAMSSASAADLAPSPDHVPFPLWALFVGVVLVLCGVAVLRRTLNERPLRRRTDGDVS
ncbi:MAG: hypothetical protein JWQ32_3400 [Marmoricola sp.]|nr:hypothetical protein [Marmoricola sp.]